MVQGQEKREKWKRLAKILGKMIKHPKEKSWKKFEENIKVKKENKVKC